MFIPRQTRTALITGGSSGLILDWVIEEGNPADSTLAKRMIERQREIYGRVPRQAAFDGGFASKENLKDIKELGVRDYFVVQEEGEHRWAVSLGIYRSEDTAQARLSALRNRGVSDARVGARDNAVPKVWLRVDNVDASLQARLKVLARQMEGSELKDCP